jgi:hypothetical protein
MHPFWPFLWGVIGFFVIVGITNWLQDRPHAPIDKKPSSLEKYLNTILQPGDTVVVDTELLARLGIPLHSEAYCDWLTENRFRQVRLWRDTVTIMKRDF